MFKKLVSNLPFTPSLLPQLSFYSKRLYAENSIRRVGMVFAIIGLVGQGFITVSPPVSAERASLNDVIYNGIGTTEQGAKDRLIQLLGEDRNPGPYKETGLKALFHKYGITVDAIKNSSLTTICSTCSEADKKLYSIGRNHNSRYPGLDQELTVSGQTYYARPLYVWDRGGSTKFKALKITDDLYVILNCGNIVTRLSPPPDQQASKATFIDGKQTSDRGPHKVLRGQEVKFRVYLDNHGGSAAKNFTVVDSIPKNSTYTIHGSGGADFHEYVAADKIPYPGYLKNGNGPGYVLWRFNSMPNDDRLFYVDMNVRVNSDAPDGALICNTAEYKNDAQTPERTNEICYKVEVPPPPKTPDEPAPKPPSPPPEQPPVVQPPVTEISKVKSSRNLTKNPTLEANNTTAYAGDIIEYSLLTFNPGSARSNYELAPEDIRDVLEYADLEDAGDAELVDGRLTWKPVQLNAEGSIEKKFSVKLKNPLPQTPSSATDGFSYDCIMTNNYGNNISINVDCSMPRKINTVSQELPKTGPGQTSFVIAGILTFGYFLYTRNKVLIKETNSIKAEYSGNHER